MRAVLAILKDSLREAIASRVLIVTLAFIALGLAASAPITYRETLTVEFREPDVLDWEKFPDALRTDSGRRENPVAARIWERLNDDEKKAFRNVRSEPPEDPNLRKIREFQQTREAAVKAIDRVLRDPEFFNRGVWARYELPLEAELLRTKDRKPDEKEVRRLNRIALEAAFPGIIETSPATSLQFYYAFLPVFDPLPVRHRQLADGVNTLLPWFIDKFVLSIGMITAIVITAPIIPQMFEPGSLHLLLSKPVSRSVLFMTKFVGGAAFVAVCATVLFVGVWLILGFRLGIWETHLLLCIPLYAMVFLVYYAVSALVGLWWRNAVLSVLAAVIFWAACYGLGVAKQSLEGPTETGRLMRLTQAGKSLIAVNQLHIPQEWDESSGTWKPVCVTTEHEQLSVWSVALGFLPQVDLPQPIGPVFDAKHEQLVRIGFSFRKRTLVFVSGRPENDWKVTETPLPVQGMTSFAALGEPDGGVLFCTRLGLYRLTRELKEPKDPPKIFGFTLPVNELPPLTQVDGEASFKWNEPAAAAIDPVDGTLAIYSRGELSLLRREADGGYRIEKKEKVHEDAEATVVPALSQRNLLLAERGGKIRLLDAVTLTEKKTFQPEGEVSVRSLHASPDGRWFAAVLHSGRVWLIDAKEQTIVRAPVRGQGDISTVLFTKDGKWLVADRINRVTEYETGTWKSLKTISPQLPLPAYAYRYAVYPIYAALPKPSEFYKTVQHILAKPDESPAKKETTVTGPPRPWAPVSSGLIFVACVLAICCVYIERQEF